MSSPTLNPQGRRSWVSEPPKVKGRNPGRREGRGRGGRGSSSHRPRRKPEATEAEARRSWGHTDTLKWNI